MDIDHRTYYPIVLVTVRPATSWDDLYDETDKAMNRLIDLTVNNCNANEEKSETGNDRGDASGNGDEKYNTNDDKTETANITPDRGDENNNNIHSTVLERNSNGTPHTENSATRDRGGSNKTRPGVSEFVVDISDIGLSMYWTVQFLVSALLYYRTVIPLIFKTALVVCPNSVIRNIAKTILSVYSFGVKVG